MCPVEQEDRRVENNRGGVVDICGLPFIRWIGGQDGIVVILDEWEDGEDGEDVVRVVLGRVLCDGEGEGARWLRPETDRKVYQCEQRASEMRGASHLFEV